jgi:thiamine biosynthesis protein ThiS
MQIEINGEARSLPEPCSVATLLSVLGLTAGKVAVEHNREIVVRSAYAETFLAEGDAVEIVHFIGGGL